MSVFSVSINPIPLYTPAERATPPTLIYHTGAFLPLCIFVRVSKFSTVNIVFIITQSNKGDKKKIKKKKALSNSLGVSLTREFIFRNSKAQSGSKEAY